MKFKYFLTYDELMEGYDLAESDKNTRKIMITQAVLAAIVVIYLVRYIADSRNFSYMMIAIAAICLDFVLVYYPVLRKRYLVRKQAEKGVYQFIIDDILGKVIFENGESIDIRNHLDEALNEKSDKKLNKKFIKRSGKRSDEKEGIYTAEGERVFVIRLNNKKILCIPKRIMDTDKQAKLRRILDSFTG